MTCTATVYYKWDMRIVNQIIDAAEEFITESKFPVTFSRSKCYDRFKEAFFGEDSDIILVLDGNGVVCAGAICYAVADWQEEKFGYVEKFFVRKEFRGTVAGRLLTDRMAVWFDNHDCLFSFATSTANIGAAGLFTNLMAKFGYKDLGPTLMRRNSNGKV